MSQLRQLDISVGAPCVSSVTGLLECASAITAAVLIDAKNVACWNTRGMELRPAGLYLGGSSV